MITSEDKKKILEEIIFGLKKQIIIGNLNIRYIEREKIRAGEAKLLELEKALKAQKDTKEGLGKTLEIAEDELAGR